MVCPLRSAASGLQRALAFPIGYSCKIHQFRVVLRLPSPLHMRSRLTHKHDHTLFRLSGIRFRISGFDNPNPGSGDRVSGRYLLSGEGRGVSGFGFRVSGLNFGSRVSDFGFWVLGFEYWVSGLGFRISGFGFRVWVSDFGL